MQVRVQVRRRGRVFATSSGQQFSAQTGAPGQTLYLPVNVTSGFGETLYCALQAWVYAEGSSAAGAAGPAGYPPLAQMVSSGEAERTFALAAGAAVAYTFTWPLAQALNPVGVYAELGAYTDYAMTQPLSGSPLYAWSNAFLTVAYPSAGSVLGFGFGSPTIQQVRPTRALRLHLGR